MPAKSKRQPKQSAPAAAPPLLTASRSLRTKRVAAIVVAMLAGAVALTFLLCWRFQFNSDGVLSSLMARSILTRAERPIYVWSVGYQGVLINAYMNALMFKLFGFGVYQVNFWPTLAYFGFTTLFILYVRDGTDDWTALFTGLFFVLSNPVICTVMLRNSPNYPETYAMGVAIFWLERLLLRHLLVEKKPPDAKVAWQFAALGLLCGFGAYTYGQIYIFMASVVAHLGFFYVRDARRSMAAPGHHWRVTTCIATLPCTVIAMGLWHFCAGTTPHPAFVPIVGATGISATVRGVAMLGAVLGVEFALRKRHVVAKLWPGALCMVAGAALGYTPALWEIVVRHHPFVNKASMSGDLSMWLQRFWLGVQGNMWHLNLTALPDLYAPGVKVSLWATVATLGVLGAFCVAVGKSGAAFMRNKQDDTWFLNIGPLCVLPVINIIIFGLSDAVTNQYSSRYTLAICLFYALAFGWFFATVLQRASRGWGWATVALGVALLCNNVQAIKRDLSQAMSQPFDGEEAIDFLRKRGITRGYANYWSAYTVNFFTDEEIILQPMFSAYCPHYGPEVAQADKIAVVDHADRLAHPASGTQINLYGRPWIVGEYWRGKTNAVLTLTEAVPHATAVVDGS